MKYPIKQQTFLFIFLVGTASMGRAQISSGLSEKIGFTEKALFRIFQGGKEIGKETFQIQCSPGQWKGSSDLTLHLKGQDPIAIHAETTLDEKGKFLAYEAQRTGEGPKMKIRVLLEDGIAICEEKGDYTSETNPVKVDPDFQLLDTNVFHHYALLALRLAMNPQIPQIQALIPQEATAGSLKVKNAAKEILKIGKKRIPVDRYELDSGQTKLSLWIDQEGKLYKILVPQTNAEVVRSE